MCGEFKLEETEILSLHGLTIKAMADVYTEDQLDKADRFLMKFVTGLKPRSKNGKSDRTAYQTHLSCHFFL